MRVLIVDCGGHLTNECGEELANLCIVLLEELLSCGGGLLNGADGGLTCGLYCGDYCIGGLRGGRSELG